MEKHLLYTKSVCPVCMREISADIVEMDQAIYMKKICKEHGDFQTLIWQDQADHYLEWLKYGGVDLSIYPQTREEAERLGGEFGFQSSACTQSCSSALMTTNRCNMNCPVCFTRAKQDPKYDPTLEELKVLIDYYRIQSGDNGILELCGGEPTVRADLTEIASYASSQGFDYIQLNSNGLKLAESIEYCRELRKSGVTTVYLGFDGMTEKPYLAKYGRSMLDVKKQAVKHCGEAGLAVVLVTCVIPDESAEELGAIITYAKEHMPTVKGVYLQPISYFGVYEEDKIKRITIPEVLRKLEEQMDGEVKKEDFGPGAYDHAQCSFNGNYVLGSNGKLKRITKYTQKVRKQDGYIGIRNAVRKTWLPSKLPTLTIGGMAFQDAWNIDLLRVARCSVQIIGKDKRMIPLCSKYLTDCKGHKLNEGIN